MTIIDPVRVIEALRIESTAGMEPEAVLARWRETTPQELRDGAAEPVVARFDGRLMVRQEFTTSSLDALVYFIQNDEGYLTQLVAFTAPGEVAEFRDTVQAIAASLEYAVPTQDPAPGEPAYAVTSYLELAAAGDDPSQYMCIQDQVSNQLMDVWIDNDESTYADIMQSIESGTELIREQLEIDYSLLFFETFHEESGEALVSISGPVRISDGVNEVFIPFSQADPLAQVLPIVDEDGWAICQTRLLTGMATVDNEPAELQPVDEPKLYWYDKGEDAVMRANYDGSTVEMVTEIHEEPISMSIDPTKQHVFWLGDYRGGDALLQAPLDRSEGQPVFCSYGFQECDLKAPLRRPNSLALDPIKGKVYWGDAGESAIHRANLDGSDVELIYDGQPLSLAIDPEQEVLYWAEAKPLYETNNTHVKAIYQADLMGANISNIAEFPGDVVAIAATPEIVYVAMERPNRIMRIELASGESQEVFSDLESLSGLAADPRTGTLFWAADNAIYQADRDGKNVRKIHQVVRPYTAILELALDSRNQ
jgi:hypothetical protein